MHQATNNILKARTELGMAFTLAYDDNNSESLIRVQAALDYLREAAAALAKLG